MPSNEDLDQLALLAVTASQRSDWQPFADYLRLRAKGLRAEALRRLDAFLNGAERWPFAERKLFLLWVGKADPDRPPNRLVMTAPLLQRMVAPTATEWLGNDPESAKANYFYALYAAPMVQDADPLHYLRRAVQLDPADQLCRIQFIDRVIGHTQNAQHELPYHGYLGAVSEDIVDLQDSQEMLAGVEHPLWRPTAATELADLLETAKAWSAFELSAERGTGFANWCVLQGGPIQMLQRM